MKVSPQLLTAAICCAVASSLANSRAEMPEVLLVAPLQGDHNVGHSWVGGFSLTYKNFGPVYLAPCFANMEPGKSEWIAKQGMELKDEGAADGLAATTSAQWGEAEVEFRMNVVPQEAGAVVKGSWNASAPAVGTVQLDMRIPPEVAEGLIIEADGQPLWSAKDGNSGRRLAFQEIQISSASDGKPIATISADNAMASTFVFANKTPPSVILQISPAREAAALPDVNDVQELSWTLKFAE